jgi:hypothetical protein
MNKRKGSTKADREAGERVRLAQAQKLLDLFEDANGRPAETMEELTEWYTSVGHVKP